MKDIMEEFAEKICTTCKGNCNRGIAFMCYTEKERKENGNLRAAKCVDYEKDETKIEKYKKPLVRTAEQERSLMGFRQY